MLCHDRRYSQYYSKFQDPRFFIGAPTRDQVKRIYWTDIKALIPPKFLAKPPNESSLSVEGINGAVLYLMGMDKPERVEGTPWDWALLDEYGNMKEKTWTEHVRAALADRKGGCDFIGVPEGMNHYYDLYDRAKVDFERDGEESDWAVWHWPSWDIVDPDEVEAARRDLDELVFNQEFGGQFIAFSGLAYYCFDEKINVGRFSHLYTDVRPLVFCFDFNVSPGVAVVLQEMGSESFDGLSPNETVTVVIDEVHIPKMSNTVRVCERLIEKWSNHPGIVLCYGDSTGGASGTAKIRGSDWDIIRAQLLPHFGDRLYFNVPIKNPRERQRVNAVNSRLRSARGDIRLLVDGKKCPMLVKDFRGTRVIEGTAGEIDKKSDPMMSHLTDSIGYYLHKEFPVQRWYDREEIQQLIENRNKRDIDAVLKARREAA